MVNSCEDQNKVAVPLSRQERLLKNLQLCGICRYIQALLGLHTIPTEVVHGSGSIPLARTASVTLRVGSLSSANPAFQNGVTGTHSHTGVSEIGGTFFGGPYDKDPTI